MRSVQETTYRTRYVVEARGRCDDLCMNVWYHNHLTYACIDRGGLGYETGNADFLGDDKATLAGHIDGSRICVRPLFFRFVERFETLLCVGGVGFHFWYNGLDTIQTGFIIERVVSTLVSAAS